MSDVAEASTLRLRFRGTLAGDGRPGPIEQRLGRRLVRLVDPDSPEGLRLLEAGNVQLIGPDGRALGHVSLRQAYGELLARLEFRLTEIDTPTEQRDLEEALRRLRTRSERLRTPIAH